MQALFLENSKPTLQETSAAQAPIAILRLASKLEGMSVQEIKEAIQDLTLEERAEVAACLHAWDNDAWDEQMKRDAASGKLNRILSQVDADIAQGKVREMP